VAEDGPDCCDLEGYTNDRRLGINKHKWKSSKSNSRTLTENVDCGVEVRYKTGRKRSAGCAVKPNHVVFNSAALIELVNHAPH